MIIEIPQKEEIAQEYFLLQVKEIQRLYDGNKERIKNACIEYMRNLKIDMLKQEVEDSYNTLLENNTEFPECFGIDRNNSKQVDRYKKTDLYRLIISKSMTYIYTLALEQQTKDPTVAKITTPEIGEILKFARKLSGTEEILKELKKKKNKLITEEIVCHPESYLISNTFPFQILNTANEKTRKTRQKNKPSGLEGLRKYADELNTDSRNKAIVMHRGTGTTQQAKIELQRNEAVMTITYEIDKFLKNANESTQKIFYFLLCKMIHHYDAETGKLSTNTIEFRIDELIEVGIYKIQQSAYKGFDETMKALESIRVDYKNTVTRRGRKPAYSDFGGGHIFARHDKKGGTAFVVLGDSDQWELKKNFSFLFAQYTILPEYAFKLSQKSFNLLSYVYARARQNSDEIHFDTLIQKLNLLNPEETKNITRDIIEPIDKAITEIEDICDGKIKFELIIDESLKLSEQIKKGYLKIYLNEDENQRFENIAHKRQKLQNKAKKTNTEKKKKQ